MLIPPFSLQTSNFCSPQNWEEWEGMGLSLMKFLLKPLNTPLISTILFSISRKKKNIATCYCLFATKWSYCCFVRHHWSYCCLFFDCCKFWLLLTSLSFLMFLPVLLCLLPTSCLVIYFLSLLCVRNYFSLMSWDCGLRLIH